MAEADEGKRGPEAEGRRGDPRAWDDLAPWLPAEADDEWWDVEEPFGPTPWWGDGEEAGDVVVQLAEAPEDDGAGAAGDPRRDAPHEVTPQQADAEEIAFRARVLHRSIRPAPSVQPDMAAREPVAYLRYELPGQPYAAEAPPVPGAARRIRRSSDARLIRWVRILSLHQKPGIWTARVLAGRLGVTERTIYRDIQALSGQFPIYNDVRGYRIEPGAVALPPLHLSLEETLVLAVAAEVLEDLGPAALGAAMREALAKIEGMLPDEMRRLADEARSRILISLQPPATGIGEPWNDGDGLGWAPRARHRAPDVAAHLAVLEACVLRSRACLITYFSAGRRATSERVIEPYGLVFREGAWYTVARCRMREGIRVFRVSRILDLEPLSETFDPPEGFSVQEFLRDAWGIWNGPPVEVEVRFSAEAAPFVRETVWHPSQVLRDHEDGSLTMTVTTTGRWGLVRWLVGFGTDAEVVRPADVRADVRRLAEGAVRRNG